VHTSVLYIQLYCAYNWTLKHLGIIRTEKRSYHVHWHTGIRNKLLMVKELATNGEGTSY